jgi:hypothetical protein
MKVGSCVNNLFWQAFSESTHYECVCVCQKKKLFGEWYIKVQTLKACAPTIYKWHTPKRQASTKDVCKWVGSDMMIWYDIIIIIIIIFGVWMSKSMRASGEGSHLGPMAQATLVFTYEESMLSFLFCKWVQTSHTWANGTCHTSCA